MSELTPAEREAIESIRGFLTRKFWWIADEEARLVGTIAIQITGDRIRVLEREFDEATQELATELAEALTEANASDARVRVLEGALTEVRRLLGALSNV